MYKRKVLGELNKEIDLNDPDFSIKIKDKKKYKRQIQIVTN